MSIGRGKILELVYASIITINEQKKNKADSLDLEEETLLLDRESKLDSLEFVTLIIDIEQRLAGELGLAVSLMDEDAGSQTKNTFQDVRSLVDHISSLLPGS